MIPNSYEYNRLIAGLAAIEQNPEDAEELSQILGIDTFLSEVRSNQESRPQVPSYLYLVDTRIGDDERYFKIGKSIHPHIRLQELRIGNGAMMPPRWEGHTIRPLALRTGGLALEASIHRDLSLYRAGRTEWFAAHRDVIKYIVDQDAWDEWRGERPPI